MKNTKKTQTRCGIREKRIGGGRKRIDYAAKRGEADPICGASLELLEQKLKEITK